MKINESIFKAYDIRGVYPEEINEKTAYLIGRAFIKFLNFSNQKRLKIVVGRDSRLSSTKLFNTLTKGMIDEGADVVSIGLSSTPMLYWVCANFKFDGGINVTGSHLSAEYNGFKLVRKGAVPISEESGIKEIKDLVLNNKFETGKKGKIVQKDFLKEYIKFNLKDFDSKLVKSLKIVFDTANAVAGILVSEIFKNNHKIYHLFAKLDGRFPNHNPDPLVKDNLKTLSKTVKEKKADLGVAFDGDGDRIIFIDEKGQNITGDLITAFIAESILKKKPREKIIYDVRSSNVVKETIKKAGGVALAWRIGHTLIKEKMRKENVIFAGELSGHYYHRDYYFCECPLFILFKVIETISQSKKPISELIREYKKYFNSGEINFKVSDKEKILKEIENNPPGGGEKGEIMKIDGLRIDFKDWWFLLRPSNTEPLLRLVIEAKTEKLLKEKIKKMKLLIENLAK